MGSGDGLSVLVVEDDAGELAIYERDLTSRGFVVTPVNTRTGAIPNGRYGAATIDGLKGAWKFVADGINVPRDHIVVLSGDDNILAEAVAEGLQAMHKAPPFYDADKLVEMLK